MTPTDEAAQAATVTARAAAGMCDADEMRRTKQQAQSDIAQSAEAMQAVYGPQAAPQDYRIANRPGNPNWRGVAAWFDEAAAQLPADDFSLLNDEAIRSVSDAALFAADQGEDFDAYMRQLCGDRPDGIIEQYSAATEGRWK